MKRYKNTISLLWKILKKNPLIMTLSFFLPVMVGIITVNIYKSQARLIDILVKNIGVIPYFEIIKLSIVPLIIYLVASLLILVFNMFRNISTIKLVSKSTELLQSLVQSVTIFSSIMSLVLLALSSGYVEIALVICIMIIINLTIKVYTEVKVVRLGRNITFDGRVGDYIENMLYRSDMLRETRIYNCLSYFKSIWTDKIKYQNNIRYNARRTEIKTGIVVTFVQTTTILFIMLYFLKQVNNSSISIGLMSVMILGLLQSGYKILTLSWPLGQFYVKSSRLYDLNQILNYKNNYINNGDIQSDEIMPIIFENVSFKYPNSNNLVLDKFNLIIHKKEKIAVIGENGVGKSTFVKLLIGLFKAKSGIIKWGGESNVPDNIAIVYQDYIKYELTLCENIGFGNMKKFNNDEEILKVIKMCGLLKMYEELGGLDVKLGRLYEGARELSGGQWQRIAIAQALLKDAELIIFDEPTAAIDPNAELDIYNMLMDLFKDKAMIMISHRLGWAKKADRIIVLRDGHIVEDGNHDELINKSGIYAKMYNLQSSWYISENKDSIEKIQSEIM